MKITPIVSIIIIQIILQEYCESVASSAKIKIWEILKVKTISLIN